jgi:uncharacterized lipoprotein YehR (DUF1307 family)
MRNINYLIVVIITLSLASCTNKVEYKLEHSYQCYNISGTEVKCDSAFADKIVITRLSKSNIIQYQVDVYLGKEKKNRLGIFNSGQYKTEIDNNNDTIFIQTYSIDENSELIITNATNYKIEDVFKGDFDECLILTKQQIMETPVVLTNVFNNKNN